MVKMEAKEKTPEWRAEKGFSAPGWLRDRGDDR
jgi:hypothetical protein